MGVLTDNQHMRDGELAELLNLSLEEVEALGIATPDSIRVYNGDKSELSEEEVIKLYSHYGYLNLNAYLKTLMLTSIKGRHRNLIELLNSTTYKKCLDFGSGVGTHAIALLENGCEVTLLDVAGSELLEFAIKRIKLRHLATYITIDHESSLPQQYYDLVICSDVLEHVFDPMAEIKRITKSLKSGGMIFLEVSKMVKPSSGHFKPSIVKWLVEGEIYMKSNYKYVKECVWRKK